MRLKIQLQMNGVHLPYTYQRGIQAYLYSALDVESASHIHDETTITPFVFSDLMGKHITDEKGITYPETAVLFVASPFQNFLEQVFKHMTSAEVIEINGNIIPIKMIQGIENNVHQGVIAYHTISPVTAYKTDDTGYHTYYSPADNAFREIIYSNVAHKYQQIFGEEMHDYINLYKPDHVRKHMRRYKQFQYICYDFEFKLDTTPEVHNLLLDTGIGARNAAGFGMIEELKRRN